MRSFPLAMAAYRCFRALGRPVLAPFNLVVSVTDRCQSRCGSCRIWAGTPGPELSPPEYDRVFGGMGGRLLWATITGGEPFLRHDLPQIAAVLCRRLEPRFLTIPTNGLEPSRVFDAVDEMVRSVGETRININISMDGIMAEHDRLRGVDGAFERGMETFVRLRRGFGDRIGLGFHTVVGNANAARLGLIQDYLALMRPTTLGAEPAEARFELGTQDGLAAVEPNAFRDAARAMLRRIRPEAARGPARLALALRRRYYSLAYRIMVGRRQVIPCYCGFASAHITASGQVWDCCVQARVMGDLRAEDYDFAAIWASGRARDIRRRITRGDCFCPMANAAFVNMVLDPGTALALARDWFFNPGPVPPMRLG